MQKKVSFYSYPSLYNHMIKSDSLYAKVINLEHVLYYGNNLEYVDLYKDTLSYVGFLSKEQLRFLIQEDPVSLYKFLFLLPSFTKTNLGVQFSLLRIVMRTRIYLKFKLKFNLLNQDRNFINLVSIEKISNQKRISFLDEIKANESMWFFNTRRQNMSHGPHRKTNAIVLFGRHPNALTMKFDPLDSQWRYGVSMDYAFRYPELSKWILEFEKKMDGVPGRVVLVRLSPGSFISGHCDSETELMGFDRYHLVVDSEKGSYMHVSDEQKVFSEGEVFFFENKKWHTAYNTSKSWRIHLIIDIKLPKKNTRSFVINDYVSWKKWSSLKK